MSLFGSSVHMECCHTLSTLELVLFCNSLLVDTVSGYFKITTENVHFYSGGSVAFLVKYTIKLVELIFTFINFLSYLAL
jgi:hypothetical protein